MTVHSKAAKDTAAHIDVGNMQIYLSGEEPRIYTNGELWGGTNAEKKLLVLLANRIGKTIGRREVRKQLGISKGTYPQLTDRLKANVERLAGRDLLEVTPNSLMLRRP